MWQKEGIIKRRKQEGKKGRMEEERKEEWRGGEGRKEKRKEGEMKEVR